MIDMGLFRKCCSVVTILPQILPLNTLVCVLPLSIRTTQLNQLNKAIRVVLILVLCTDHLILGRKRVKGYDIAKLHRLLFAFWRILAVVTPRTEA